jgi:hypothetical protein
LFGLMSKKRKEGAKFVTQSMSKEWEEYMWLRKGEGTCLCI